MLRKAYGTVLFLLNIEMGLTNDFYLKTIKGGFESIFLSNPNKNT